MTALLTFIVYFITVLCGYINIFLSHCFGKIYFPLRSYLTAFNREEILNFNRTSNSLCNLAGFKAVIKTNIPYKLIDDLFFTLIAVLLIVLFYIGYKIVQSQKISQSHIIGWSLLFSFLMTVAIPSNSSDVYGYIARGAQQSVYHQHPYLETVSNIKNYRTNEMFCNFMWPFQPTTYGSIFIFMTRTIVQLSNNNFLSSLVNFKLLNLFAFLVLIYYLLKRNKTEDIYLLSWNPLILIQGLWNCHNDLISGMLIFVSLCLLTEKKRKTRHFWFMFILTAAIGIKYVPLIILPLIFIYYIQSKTEKTILLNLILGLVSGIILILIFSVEYLTSLSNLTAFPVSKFFSNVSLIHKSMISALDTIFKYFCNYFHFNLNLLTVYAFIKTFVYSIFITIYLAILFRKKSDLIRDIVFILFIFFSFTIAKFHSWYLLNLIILIPFLKNDNFSQLLKNILIVLSLSHVLAITFIDQAKILNFLLMTLIPVIMVRTYAGEGKEAPGASPRSARRSGQER